MLCKSSAALSPGERCAETDFTAVGCDNVTSESGAVYRRGFFLSKNFNPGDYMGKTKSPVTAADLAKNGYRQQWGVIVICENENDQIRKYEDLKKQYPDRKIKVVTT